MRFISIAIGAVLVNASATKIVLENRTDMVCNSLGERCFAVGTNPEVKGCLITGDNKWECDGFDGPITSQELLIGKNNNELHPSMTTLALGKEATVYLRSDGQGFYSFADSVDGYQYISPPIGQEYQIVLQEYGDTGKYGLGIVLHKTSN